MKPLLSPMSSPTSEANDLENLPPMTNKVTMYEFCRWAALMEAVDIIAEKCEDRKIDFDGPEGMKYIKPLDIQDYVNMRTDTLMMKMRTARGIEKNLTNIKCLQIEKQLKRLEVAD